jgi:hypothetical protein
MLRRAIASLALLTLSPGASFGCAGRQALPAHSRQGELLAPERVVTVAVAPLGHGVLVTLHIAHGYHIMSDRPSDPNFIATRVALESSDLKFESPTYPPAVPYTLAARTIATFRDRAEVFVRYAADSGVTSSSDSFAVVDVRLRYQACTESTCLFPVTRYFSTRIPLRPRAGPSGFGAKCPQAGACACLHSTSPQLVFRAGTPSAPALAVFVRAFQDDVAVIGLVNDRLNFTAK